MDRNLFAVLGLGHFGSHAARVLYEAGKNVIAVDSKEEAVQEIADSVTRAVLADATDRQTLISIGVQDVDAAIISLGSKLDVITLAALQVIEIGVPYVAVKALSEDHGKILNALGVHEVIHPEKEMAIRLASRLARKNVVDFLPIAPGYSIREIKAPKSFVGKSLSELALRNTLHVQLIAIEQNRTMQNLDINIVPCGEDVIQSEDILVLLGKNRDLDRIADIF